MFQTSSSMFGSELSGELISNLAWSPSGKYLAASMTYCLNIWTLSSSECHIEDYPTMITALAWPGDTTSQGIEYLLVGRIDGTVSLVSIQDKSFITEELISCNEQCEFYRFHCFLM